MWQCSPYIVELLYSYNLSTCNSCITLNRRNITSRHKLSVRVYPYVRISRLLQVNCSSAVSGQSAWSLRVTEKQRVLIVPDAGSNKPIELRVVSVISLRLHYTLRYMNAIVVRDQDHCLWHHLITNVVISFFFTVFIIENYGTSFSICSFISCRNYIILFNHLQCEHFLKMLDFFPTEFFKLRIRVKHHRWRHLCWWQLCAVFCTRDYISATLQFWCQFISSHSRNVAATNKKQPLTTGEATDKTGTKTFAT